MSAPNLKLTNRRRRHKPESLSQTFSSSGMTVDMGSKENKAPMTGAEKMIKFSGEIQKLKEDVEVMLEEKQFILQRIQDDNLRLNEILSEIRSAKYNLISQIEAKDNEPILQDVRRDAQSESTKRKDSPPIIANNVFEKSKERSYDLPESFFRSEAVSVPLGVLEDKRRDEFEALPEHLKETSWHVILAHISQLIRGHPLAPSLHPGLIQEAILECSEQLKSYIARSIHVHISSENKVSMSDNTISLDDLEDLIISILQSTNVHAEVASVVTLIMSYSFVRFADPSLVNGIELESLHSSQGLPFDFQSSLRSDATQSEQEHLLEEQLYDSARGVDHTVPASQDVSRVRHVPESLAVEVAPSNRTNKTFEQPTQFETMTSPFSKDSQRRNDLHAREAPLVPRTTPRNMGSSKTGDRVKPKPTSAAPLNIEEFSPISNKFETLTLNNSSISSPSSVPSYMQPTKGSMGKTKK